MFMCIFVNMWMFLFLCFSNYYLPIVYYQQYMKGKRYKCFTSASTFFQSICDILNLVSYNALLKYFFSGKFYISASPLLDITLFILFAFCFGNKLDRLMVSPHGI